MSHRAPPKRRVVSEDPLLRAVKRATLFAFGFALVAMAVVGVWMLVFSTSSQISEKVFGSLLTVVIYGGIVLAVVQTASRGIGPKWFCWTVTAVAVVSTALIMAEIWISFGWARWPGFATALSLTFASAAAWPSAVLHHRERWRPFAVAGLVIAAAAALVTTADAWIGARSLLPTTDLREKAIFSLWCLAGAACQTGLLGMLRMRTVPAPLLGGAALLGWLLACVLTVMRFDETLGNDFSGRVIGVLAILAVCATLLCGIVSLARSGRAKATAPGSALINEIQVVCPVCSTAQRVGTGASNCSVCRCRFDIAVTPVHCPGCGYALADLPERKCPECGRSF